MTGTDNLNREVREITSEEEWLAWRRGYITGTKVPIILGLNPYENIDGMIAEMVGNGKEIERTRVQRAGLLAEHMMPAAIMEERPDWVVRKSTTFHAIPELRLAVTPDFWANDDIVIQGKSVSRRRWDHWQGVPPLMWSVQTLTEAIVTDKAMGVIAVIVRDDELPLYLFEFQRNPAAEQKVLDAVAEFWRKFDAGEFPISAQSSTEIATILDDGSHIDLSGDNRLPEWLERREQWSATRYEMDKNIKGVDYEIKQRMGKALTASLEGWQISNKWQHRKAQAATDFQVLRVKRTKEMDDADIG